MLERVESIEPRIRDYAEEWLDYYLDCWATLTERLPNKLVFTDYHNEDIALFRSADNQNGSDIPTILNSVRNVEPNANIYFTKRQGAIKCLNQNSDKKISVGDIRKTQLITTYGVGAIVDFKNDTVVIASTDDWDYSPNDADEVENRKIFSFLRSFISFMLLSVCRYPHHIAYSALIFTCPTSSFQKTNQTEYPQHLLQE